MTHLWIWIAGLIPGVMGGFALGWLAGRVAARQKVC